MSGNVTVRKIGNSYGVIIPKADLDRMGVTEGDALYLVNTPDGVRLTPYSPELAEVMDATRDYMNRHRDALKELAK